MVSFWPWKGDDTSAASFEKVLSQLSTKINTASARDDRLRQHQRRYKVLWTLYTSFAYILVALILLLVTGWQHWSGLEYTAVAGGPVLIYGVRTGLDAYYNYRLAGSQTYLNDLNKQRDTAIDKLKAATKYNSTQQLLEKYGGSPSSAKSSPQAAGKRNTTPAQGQPKPPQQQQRTGIAPPPTANIPSRQPPMSVMQPQHPSRPTSTDSPQRFGAPNEEFAPNAFTQRPPPPPQKTSQYALDGPKWYDRLLDVVLGDDETQPKNRIVLICQSCRLVNGQAPPSARSEEDIGRWRCSACGAWNGVESEAHKVLEMARSAGAGDTATSPKTPTSASSRNIGADAKTEDAVEEDVADYDNVSYTDDDEEDAKVGDADEQMSPAGSTRSKVRQRKKA